MDNLLKFVIVDAVIFIVLILFVGVVYRLFFEKIKTKAKLTLSKRGFDRFKEPFFTKDYPELQRYDIGDFTYGHPRLLYPMPGITTLRIGRYCSIAMEVSIFLGGEHRMDWISTYPFSEIEEFKDADVPPGHPAAKGDVVIGNDVWIGRGAAIMSGVTIGDGAVVGAYSLVTKNIAPYEVWGGNPARKIKMRFNDEQIRLLQETRWWEADMQTVKQMTDLLCSSSFENYRARMAQKA